MEMSHVACRRCKPSNYGKTNLNEIPHGLLRTFNPMSSSPCVHMSHAALRFRKTAHVQGHGSCTEYNCICARIIASDAHIRERGSRCNYTHVVERKAGAMHEGILLVIRSPELSQYVHIFRREIVPNGEKGDCCES